MAEWDVPGFTELRALGSGAFGEVVLARHDGSGTLVAIKYLRQDLLSDAEFTEAFRSEAAILATVTTRTWSGCTSTSNRRRAPRS